MTWEIVPLASAAEAVRVILDTPEKLFPAGLAMVTVGEDVGELLTGVTVMVTGDDAVDSSVTIRSLGCYGIGPAVHYSIHNCKERWCLYNLKVFPH